MSIAGVEPYVFRVWIFIIVTLYVINVEEESFCSGAFIIKFGEEMSYLKDNCSRKFENHLFLSRYRARYLLYKSSSVYYLFLTNVTYTYTVKRCDIVLVCLDIRRVV